MTDLFYQGKLIRQFWGKIIRQSTFGGEVTMKNDKNICTPGGGNLEK